MAENSFVVTLVAGSVLMTIFVFYITIFMIAYKNKTRRHKMEKKELEFKYENELLQARLEIQEKSMSQLSREIHDNIGQTLSAIQVNLSMLPADHANGFGPILEQSRSQLSKAVSDLRNVSHVLNSEYINNIGLEESLKKEIDYLGAYNEITFDLEAEGEPDHLSGEKELMIFRIAQEALTNIIKHAQATRVSILLRYYPSDFSLLIRDNGVGFDMGDNGKAKGIGVINMLQRAKLMNGKIDIKSAAGNGTEIELNIPL